MKPCAQCDTETRRRVFCSEKCRKLFEHDVVMGLKRGCVNCHYPIDGAPQKKFCSQSCRQKYRYANLRLRNNWRKCEWCKERFLSVKKAIFCGPGCRKMYSRRYYRERGTRKYHELKPDAKYSSERLVCPRCDVIYTRDNGRKWCYCRGKQRLLPVNKLTELQRPAAL